MNKREIEREEKLRLGLTRKQMAEKHYEEFKVLRAKGYKLPKIANEMKMSYDTIKRYSIRLNKEKEM